MSRYRIAYNTFTGELFITKGWSKKRFHKALFTSGDSNKSWIFNRYLNVKYAHLLKF